MKPLDCGIRIAPFAIWTLLVPAGCLRPDPSKSVETSVARAMADEQGRILWDGARISPWILISRGNPRFGWEGGKGWATCDSKPNCQATLAARAGVGVDGSNDENAKGLEFHAAGVGWAWWGWNWCDFRPRTGGMDLRPYRSLTFQIRVEPKSGDTAPDPRTIAVLLACSDGNKTTAPAMVQKYDGSFDDGKWHKIAIPIVDLSRNQGAEFDWESVWEFRLASWSATPRDFNIYVDKIAAEN
jgi:hypothetical protein